MEETKKAIYNVLHSVACAKKGIRSAFVPSKDERFLVNTLVGLGAITCNEDGVYHLTAEGQGKLILATLSQIAETTQTIQQHAQEGSPMWRDLQEIGTSVALLHALLSD